MNMQNLNSNSSQPSYFYRRKKFITNDDSKFKIRKL